MIYLVIALGIFIFEIVLKDYIEKNKSEEKEEKILNGQIIVTKYHNSGCFLNFLEDKKELVVTITGILFGMVLMLFVLVLPQRRKPLLKLALACLTGGAASNLYDRIRRGYVVDYFSFSFLKKVVFNLSDLFIFFGSFLLLIISVFKEK